jgi:Terpene cyclase DEP1
MFNARVTPSMIFYGAFAAAGAIVPWYFNIKYMQESGELLTPQAWLAGGFINPLTASITTDFVIGTTPVLVWMVVEARRLGMRHWWFYIVTTFLVAFAFACPLFLFMREAHVRVSRVRE